MSEFQSALIEILKADLTLVDELGGKKIYDHVPSKMCFPYICLAKMQVQDWDTSSDQGIEYYFDLHVWSKQRGRNESYRILSHIKRLLDNQNLPLEMQNLVNLSWQFSEIERDDEARCYLGIIRFRAVSEILNN